MQIGRLGWGWLARISVAVIAVLPLSAVGASDAEADAYPTRPVHLIVPFPPGGGNDVVARIVAEKLGETLGQPVVIDNRGGGGGTLGAQLAARAAPDGYTLFLGQTHTLSINPHLYTHIAYDPQKDFAPVSLIASAALVLVVNPSLPVRTVAELIGFAKAHPGAVNFASPGNGSDGHLTGELFKSTTHISITHVPYKGTGPALTDLLAGQVQLFFCTLPPAVPHVRAGTLRALAVTSSSRSRVLSDVPTVNEAGVPGFEAAVRYGVLAPAGTPEPIVARLNDAIRRAMADEAVHARLLKTGAEPLVSTPEAYAADLAAELAKWGEVVRASGAHVD